MAKKLSGSSRPAKLISVSAEDILKRPLSKKQIGVLTRIADRQAVDDDSAINYEDAPALSDQQLADAFRPREKQLITARLDVDVLEWLKSYGDGYSTRLNFILRSAMAKSVEGKRLASRRPQEAKRRTPTGS